MSDAIAVCLLIPGGALVLLFCMLVLIRRQSRGPSDHLLHGLNAICERCGTPRMGSNCAICNWPAAPTVSAPRRALDSLQQRIEMLKSAGVLAPSAADRLIQSVTAELREIAAAQPAPAVHEVVHAELVEAELVDSPPQIGPRPQAVQPIPTAVVPPMAVAHEAATHSTGPPVSLDVAARARQFEQRAQQHRTALPDAPVVPQAPRARLADLLSTFMEEKNVRWGELIGGLLIVGGSIALVITFWKQIAERELLKFGLLNGIVAGIFALGLYSERKWKLPTTSRALLVIATLLVPLNFLAMAAVMPEQSTRPLFVAGEIFSGALFAGLVYCAGRTLAPGTPLALAIGVIGSSIAQLLIRRWGGPGLSPASFYGLIALPLLCHAGAVGWMIARLRWMASLAEPDVQALFRILGLTAFAVVPPCGMLLSLSGTPAATLERLAPLVTLAGTPALAGGLLLWRRLRDTEFSGLRTAGTAIALLGSGIMLGGLVLAWPDPALVVVVAAIDFVVLTCVAIAYELPAAHFAAAVAMLLGFLVGTQAVRGELSWWNGSSATTLRALGSAASGNLLLALAAVYAGGMAAFRWLGRSGDSRYYALITGGIGAGSLALVTMFGFRAAGDPEGTTWVYGLYAAGALVSSAILSRRGEQLAGRLQHLPRGLAWAGSVLLALAQIQGLVYRPLPDGLLAAPWTTSFVVHALVALSLAIGLRFWRGARDQVVRVLQDSAAATSLVAATCLAMCSTIGWNGAWIAPSDAATLAALVAIAWFVAAYLRDSAEWFSAAQTALFAATGLAGIGYALRQPWWHGDPAVWADPRLVQIVGCLGMVICLVWIGLRILVGRLAARREADSTTDREYGWQRTARFLTPGWPGVDYVVTGVVLLALVGVATYAAWPGMAQELSPASVVDELSRHSPGLVQQVSPQRLVPAARAFELAGVPHSPAWSQGSWLLLGLTALVLVVGLWEQANIWRVWGVLLAAGAVCPLLAARFEPDVAVASALRWLAAGYFLLTSIGVWSRAPLARWGARIGWRGVEQPHAWLTSTSIGGIALLAAAPLAAMGAYVAQAAITSLPIDTGTLRLMGILGVTCAASAVVALVLAALGRTQPATAQGSSPAPASIAPAWRTWSSPIAAVVVVLGAAPLLTTLIYVVAARLADNPVVGPNPGSLFETMSLAVNYSVPAALVALVLVGYAIRERSAPFAFVAGLVTNLTATIAFLFSLGGSLTTSDPRLWTQLGLLNSLVAALFGLVWCGAVAWWQRGGSRAPAERLQIAQAGLAIALLLLVLSAVALGFSPGGVVPSVWLADPATPLGIAAFVASFGLAFGMSIARSRVATTALAATALWSAATLSGAAAVPWDTGNWLALHVLLSARIAGPWLLLAGGWWWYRREVLALDDRPRLAVTWWASLLALPLLVVSLRCMGNTAPGEPWWSSGGILSAGVLAACLAIWSCRRAFLYPSSGLVLIAAVTWYIRGPLYPSGAGLSEELLSIAHVALIALALPVIAWLGIELRAIRPQRDLLPGPRFLPAHRSMTWLALLGLGFLTWIGIAADSVSSSIFMSFPAVPAALAVGLAVVACLWDERARESVAVLYLYGLVLVGFLLDALDLEPRRLLVTATIALGAFTLATSYLWSRRAGLRKFAARLVVPTSTETNQDSTGWIRPLTTLVILGVQVLAFITMLTWDDRELRITTGFAAIFQAFSLGMLAEGSRRTSIQRDALVAGMVGAIAFAWAFISPGDPLGVLNRSVATCVALVIVSIVYSLGLAKLPLRLSDWVTAAQRFAPVSVAALAGSVAIVLLQELSYYLGDGAVPLSWAGMLAVALSLAALFLASLAAAVIPGRDPLGFGERGRMLYVYAAEVVLALSFLHIRLTMPWLFQGIFLAWWPLVVIVIAFLGVGLGEWFARRQQTILATPLERTGILLPLLPVLAFWFVGESNYQTNYSVVLLVVGGLYATLAVTRKSMGFGLLAALAANGGLWHYLHGREGIGLLEHPQLWLIPPALCVLAAAYLNRDRLSLAQMTAIRYITSMTIYLSSTADIFLQGVAEAPWLPVVLAALSVAGVLFGIMLRVRAFLFLGSGFLVLSVLTMIWHVAVDLDQIWVWPAALVALGILVMVFFGVGEKRRHDMLRMVDELKQWQA